MCRFGFEIIEYFAKELKFNIIIIDSSETEKSKQQEFAEDIISIIQYFSMRLYGSRSYKKKIKSIENNLTELIKEGKSLFYLKDGKKIPIKRIYNRIIFDDLQK